MIGVDVEYVDLGLPSGTLWASNDLKLTQSTQGGSKFAWGEIQEKSSYNWNNYEFGTQSALTKYCQYNSCGSVDNKTILEKSDDAARIHLKGYWKIPTSNQFLELANYCTKSTIILNGQQYLVFTSYNGNSIKFLFNAENINWWTSELSYYGIGSDLDSYFANSYQIYTSSSGIQFSKTISQRCEGNFIRPVYYVE